MSYMCRFSTSVASNYMRGVRPKTTTNVKRMTTAREPSFPFSSSCLSSFRCCYSP